MIEISISGRQWRFDPRFELGEQLSPTFERTIIDQTLLLVWIRRREIRIVSKKGSVMKLSRGSMVSPEFLVTFLAALRTVLGTEDDLDDPSTCSRSKSLFEIPGDAVLSGKTRSNIPRTV